MIKLSGSRRGQEPPREGSRTLMLEVWVRLHGGNKRKGVSEMPGRKGLAEEEPNWLLSSKGLKKGSSSDFKLGVRQGCAGTGLLQAHQSQWVNFQNTCKSVVKCVHSYKLNNEISYIKNKSNKH